MVNYWSIINHMLAPAQCALCSVAMPHNIRINLCEACTLSLPWINHACRCCGATLNKQSPGTLLCGNCQKTPPAFSQSCIPFQYQYPIDRLVTRLKFKHELLYANTLAELLSCHVQFHYEKEALPDLIIPVPLHRKRLRERGFNQAQEIAQRCAKNLKLKMDTTSCWRQKNTAHQPGLSAKERRKNLKNAFCCNTLKPGTRVALIDDVMTTGTTLNELASCIKKAGGSEIHLWCIARATHK